jgi:hypothetical protein
MDIPGPQPLQPAKKTRQRTRASFIVDRSISISVDYEQPFLKMIEDGCYTYVNSAVTEKYFPTSQRGNARLKIKIVCFRRPIMTQEVLAEITGRGDRVVTLAELLAIGAQHPGLQSEFPIIELGTLCQSPRGNNVIAFLFGGGGAKAVGMHTADGQWSEYCRFAIVRVSDQDRNRDLVS